MCIRDSTDTDSAFLQLLTLWKASYVPSSIDGCTQAKAQGLQCLAQRGSLAQLRLLNRPAILMLSDDSGSMYQVVLRGLTDEAAQVQIGTHMGSVAIAELARYWFGDFVLVWRPATNSVQMCIRDTLRPMAWVVPWPSSCSPTVRPVRT